MIDQWPNKSPEPTWLGAPDLRLSVFCFATSQFPRGSAFSLGVALAFMKYTRCHFYC